MSVLKTKMTKHDLHTVIALKILQNVENDVFVDSDTKESRKTIRNKLERKREALLDKIDLSDEELEIIKEKRKQSVQKMEENRAKMEKMQARAQKHANSFKSKPTIKTPDKG